MKLTIHSVFCSDQQAGFATDSPAKSYGDKVSTGSHGNSAPNKDALIDPDDITDSPQVFPNAGHLPSKPLLAARDSL
jgi:hypothetical protein